MEQSNISPDLVKLAAGIITANCYGQGFRPAELVEALQQVYHGLQNLQQPAPPPEQPLPDWRTSIKEGYVTCLLCGQTAKVLAPHLRRAHQLSLKEYRQKFGIPRKVSLVSRQVRTKRSQQAKERNLAQYLRK